ncbi:hypothetical protein TSAR_016563 [Trichomalopsis sarcophagae]|uniref:C-type lectin domain-containing protein n=1 Tax=Trichomalopsis sarcophagae TaxID=543379 RepID=A0A232EUF4_9HYME|nr:hypothetical protein TSAR_016563 [Trichomalopsis sarcophagae]
MKRYISLLLCLSSCIHPSTCCCRAKPKGDVNCGITYNLIKSDAKSSKSVITRRQVGSIGKCKDFAETKRALAFNFESAMTTTGSDSDNGSRETANCVLLDCPETKGLRQLVNVTGVDYYSAYPDAEYKGNESLSCIEKIGLFSLVLDRTNFTNARDNCRKMIHFPGRRTGILADPTEESRTRGLASLVGKLTVYVGLSNEGDQRVWKNEFGTSERIAINTQNNPVIHRTNTARLCSPTGDALSCSDYRAWATGDPSHNRGCVALSRSDTKAEPVWKLVSCATELPYVCEIPRIPPIKID